MLNPYLQPEAPPPPPPEVAEPAPKPWGFWATLFFGLAIGLAWVIAQTVVMLILMAVEVVREGGDIQALDEEALTALAMDGDVLGWTTLISGGAAIFFTFIVIYARRMAPHGYLGLHAPNPLQILLWIAVTLALNYGHSFLGPIFEREEIPEFMVDTYQTADSMILMWIAIALMAPLFEEVFFRGFLYTGWRRSWIGPVGAAVVTSLLWTVIHMQYDWFDQSWIFVFGLVLCVARAVTGSLWVPIAMHVFNNAWATFWTGQALGEEVVSRM